MEEKHGQEQVRLRHYTEPDSGDIKKYHSRYHVKRKSQKGIVYQVYQFIYAAEVVKADNVKNSRPNRQIKRKHQHMFQEKVQRWQTEPARHKGGGQ